MKNLEDVYPLSPLQQGMLFHSLLAPESGIYVNQCSCRLRGELDAEKFRRSWQTVVDRHSILRSAFLWEGFDEPLQAVRSRVAIPWTTDDWRGLPAAEQVARLEELRTAERHRPFPLAQAPLLRLVLIRTGENVWELVWTFHHILLDGWSVPLLLRELSSLYASGDPASLPPARPYRDYIAWLQRQDLAQAEAFWRHALSGFTSPTPLGIDRPVPAGPGGTDFAEESFGIPADVTATLQAFAARQKLTLNTLSLGAWALLLARYSGEDDVVFGGVVSGRPAELPDVELILGLFINTLPVRVRVPEAEPLAAWLRSLQTQQLELRQFEHSPLAQVQKWSDVPPGTALFESLFVFENYPMAEMRGAGGSAVTVEQVRNEESTNYPLTLAVAVDTDALLRLTYDRRRFEPAAIRRHLGHFASLLRQIAAGPDRLLCELSPLEPAELEELRAWNRTEAGFSRDRCLHELVEAQVDRDPAVVALSFAGQTLTYGELDERANQLARHLAELGCAPETRVGVLLERSLDLVVSLLAILKAGGAYVPLDPEHPAERIAFQIADAGLPLLLAQEHLLDRLPATAARIVVLSTDHPPAAGLDPRRPAVQVDPLSPAYVLYTSGSTGRPKGAAVSHRAIVNRLQWMQDAYRLGPDDRVLQKTPFSFDVSVWELFWPLLSGARLVVARPGGHRDSAYLARLIRDEGITVLHFVPSMLQMFLEEPAAGACRSLRDVMASGEALPAELAERFFARLDARLHNLYGPTEAAVDVTAWTCERAGGRGVPIGRPIWNTRIHLVDRGLRQVPVGVPGELFIAGANLARGYVGRPDLTAERFLPDPFGGPGERLYRTGDLARRRDDGAIDYLGRTDHQVKVRGFRIELGEIEAELLEQPGVRGAAVVVREREDGHRRLVAYVVAEGSLAAGDLRTALARRLPDYMVPALFCWLPQLPLSPNGKVDRRALPEPEAARPDLAEAFVPPEGGSEEILAAIWSEVLGVDRVGRDDNFFALGGDSILSLQVLAKAHEQGLELSLQQIFQHPTVRGLSRAGEGASPAAPHLRLEPFELLSDADRARLPEDVVDAYPLAKLQEGMLFHGELSGEASIYHNTSSVHLRGPLDIAKLDLALQRLAGRHPLLRTSFSLMGFGEPLQLVHRHAHISLEVHDLRSLTRKKQEKELERWLDNETRRLFDWRQPPLIRFHVHRRTDSEFQISWSEHHAILDGWSVASMTAELGQDYLALLHQGLDAPQPSTPASWFRDFVALERQVLADGEARRFWLELLRGATVTNLPRMAERPPEPPRIVSLEVPLPPPMAGQVQAVANRAGVPLKNALLAVHARVLGLVSGQDDLITGVVNNGRLEEADGERVFGLFLNTLPYRLRLDGGSWLDLARRSFEMESAMLPYRRFPLAEIQRLSGGLPLFEVAFTYMNFHVMQGFAASEEMEELGARNNVPTNFTLSVYFQLDPLSEQLGLILDYDGSQLTAQQVQSLAGYYRRALSSLVERPESRYAEECLLAEEDRRQLLFAWNPVATAEPITHCLHEIFESQVAARPEAVALVCEGESWTYGTLNQAANRLAHRLIRLGVGPETLVGLFTRRSSNLLVGILGILKAGGAYVPVDPSYPTDHVAFLLQDSGVRVVVTDGEMAPRLPPIGATVLELDAEGSLAVEEDNLAPRSLPSNLAYVIYTSGSTGRPKGVLIAHSNVVRLLRETDRWLGFGPSDVWTLFHSAAFDFSVWEIWGALLYGGRLAIVPYLVSRSPVDFLELLRSERVTVLNQTPSAFRQLAQAAEGSRPGDLALRAVIFGGEALDPADLHSWLERYGPESPRLINMYGITETTVHVTYRPLQCADCGPGAHSLLGEPIPDLAVYAVDRWLEPAPIGVPGELLVGGAGLARGYLGHPELTAERFVPDPFSGEPGARLYRSGDLACRLTDGDLEYLGRIDHQVKLRGFRIELGEIESVLRQHPDVRDAAVLLREDEPGDQRLVAYLVSEPRLALEALGGKLADEQVSHWQMVFDRTYEAASAVSDPGFSIVGWNSSYTDLPIPAAEMQEWVDGTIERILSLSPREVLEIGCGTGLLLSRLAPRCARYWATDLSAAALDHVRSALQGSEPAELRLLLREAVDFSEIPTGSFDMVVLNSVAQYFPSLDYLLKVVDGSLRALRPGGVLFLGDLRSLSLLRAFHTSVELYRAPSSTPLSQIRQRVQARQAEDDELVLSPLLFTALAGRFPEIGGVRILLRRGRHTNEMSAYRFDALLRVGEAALSPRAPERLEWQGGPSLELLRRRLARDRPEALLLDGVPNSRLARAVRAVELLDELAGDATVSDLHARLTDNSIGGPEDLWSLAAELRYTAEIGPSGDGRDGRMQALFLRNGTPPVWQPPQSDADSGGRLDELANEPLFPRILSALVPRLRDDLKRLLPEHMVPSSFVLLPELPLTAHGKLDRRALPPPNQLRSDLGVSYVPPRSPVEQKLAEIWSEVLRLDRVGVEDNFFEIGGHSLLATQIVVRVREAFETDLPLRTLYTAPTVAGLAFAILQQKAEEVDDGLLERLLEQVGRMPDRPFSSEAVL